MGAFHLVKISGISGSAVNGTRFVGSSHWKIPRKSGKSKKVGPFSRLEFPNGMSCSIYVSRSLYQFQVHGRAPPRGSFENEALENEDRSTKHPNLENEAPKSRKRSTLNLKTKHPKLENEAP